jgi:hypothetical protein
VPLRTLILAAPVVAAGLALAQAPSAPASAPAANPFVRFTDVAAAAHITFVHDSWATPDKFMYETFGSGVAWIDYDQDGAPDLFFTNGRPTRPNALYHNNRDGTFTDVTNKAGLAGVGGSYRTGIAVGDIDNDGDEDLFVAANGPNILYRNNGDGTFTDVTAQAGVAGGDREWSSSAGFFDYDGDGDLDLYVANYLELRPSDNPYCGFNKPGYRTYCNPTLFDGTPDRLFRNDGQGRFTDVSKAAGIANPAGKGLGVTFCDVDGDGRTDIYVANDLVRNFLYHNNGDGTFKDVAYGAGVGFDANGKPQAGMGVDCGDVTGDGRPELFVTNFADELNTLYENVDGEVFEDISQRAGLGSGFAPLGFGTAFLDLDNDGDLDIYVANGHVVDNVSMYTPAVKAAQRGLVYVNDGAGHFTDVSAAAGPGPQIERISRGLAVADYDNDGDLDIAISNLGAAPLLLRNEAAPGRHWVTLSLHGTASNRRGLGARVEIEAGGKKQVRVVNNVVSYLSASDSRLHIGLGEAARIDSLVITWPSGTRQAVTDAAVDRVLDITEPSGATE